MAVLKRLTTFVIMRTIKKDLEDIHFLAGLTDNVFVQAKINRIKKDILGIIQSTPNDMDLGAKIRKLLCQEYI